MALTDINKVKSYLGITSCDNDDIIQAQIEAVSTAIESLTNRTFTKQDFVEEINALDNSLILTNTPVNNIYGAFVGDKNVIKIDYTGTGIGSVEVYTDKVTLYENFSGTSYAFSTYSTISTLATQMNTQSNFTVTVEDTDYNGWSPKLLWTGNQAIDVDGEDIYLEMAYEPSIVTEIYNGLYNVQTNRYHKVLYNGGYTTIPEDLQEIATKAVVDLYQSRKADMTLQSEKIGDYSYTRGSSSEVTNIVKSYKSILSIYMNKVM